MYKFQRETASHTLQIDAFHLYNQANTCCLGKACCSLVKLTPPSGRGSRCQKRQYCLRQPTASKLAGLRQPFEADSGTDSQDSVNSGREVSSNGAYAAGNTAEGDPCNCRSQNQFFQEHADHRPRGSTLRQPMSSSRSENTAQACLESRLHLARIHTLMFQKAAGPGLGPKKRIALRSYRHLGSFVNGNCRHTRHLLHNPSTPACAATSQLSPCLAPLRIITPPPVCPAPCIIHHIRATWGWSNLGIASLITLTPQACRAHSTKHCVAAAVTT